MASILKIGLFHLYLLFIQNGFAQGLLAIRSLNLTQQLDGTSTVVCDPSYKWAENSLGQNPCLITAWVIGDCGLFGGTVEPLTPPVCRPYNTPSEQSSLYPSGCSCSSVTYNLISACAACQGEPYVTYKNYSAACPPDYVTDGDLYQGSIPSGTRIPAWAYLRPSQNNWWYNAPLSKKTGGMPENQRPSNPTGISDYHPPKPSCSGGPKNDLGGGSKSTKATTIVGGALGGAAAVAAVGAVAYIVHAKMAAAGSMAASASAAKGAGASAGMGASASYGTSGGVSAAAGAVQAPFAAHGAGMSAGLAGAHAPFAAGGAAGAAPGVSASVGSGAGMAGSSAASGMGASAGSGFGAAGSGAASGISASAGAFVPGATASTIPAASMAPGVSAAIGHGTAGASAGFVSATGPGIAGMAPGFAGASSGLVSGGGAGLGPVIGGVSGGAGGAAAVGFWAKNRPNNQDARYVPEMATMDNDTSRLLSLRQPPSYANGSVPPSPVSSSPSLLLPGSRPPMSPNTPSVGDEYQPNQTPYYTNYLSGPPRAI